MIHQKTNTVRKNTNNFKKVKKFQQPYLAIPMNDMMWVMAQTPAVIQLFQASWLCDPYGSRWMNLTTNLSTSAFRKARKILSQQGLFIFQRQTSCEDSRETIGWQVKNLHGARVKEFWQNTNLYPPQDTSPPVENLYKVENSPPIHPHSSSHNNSSKPKDALTKADNSPQPPLNQDFPESSIFHQEDKSPETPLNQEFEKLSFSFHTDLTEAKNATTKPLSDLTEAKDAFPKADNLPETPLNQEIQEPSITTHSHFINSTKEVMKCEEVESLQPLRVADSTSAEKKENQPPATAPEQLPNSSQGIKLPPPPSFDDIEKVRQWNAEYDRLRREDPIFQAEMRKGFAKIRQVFEQLGLNKKQRANFNNHVYSV